MNVDQKLDALYEQLKSAQARFSGYPCNTHFDYSKLYRFLNFVVNNVGDPFGSTNYQVNTHEIEREALSFFIELLHGKPENIRGYISNGGTEGNLFGLNLGFERFPEGIIYFSARSHYSIKKIVNLIRAPYREIPVMPNGEIDYELLCVQLKKNNDKPAIINLNIGTTMAGAIDKQTTILEALRSSGIKNYYLHGDAALSGMVLPFINTAPIFDFRSEIDSLSISGHKFIGSPLPCGIALARAEHIIGSEPNIAYVRIIDSTISGSRNGITPLMMWYAIQTIGRQGFLENAKQCLENTEYAVKYFNQQYSIPAWKNEHSITVVFPRPNENMVQKWQLATHEDIAHIVIMPQADKSFLRSVIDDVAKNGY